MYVCIYFIICPTSITSYVDIQGYDFYGEAESVIPLRKILVLKIYFEKM